MKTKKGICLSLLIVVLAIVLAACSGGNSEQGSEKKSNGTGKFDFSGIAWGVKNGLVEGDRMPVFGYENNTGYDITEFNLSFKVKDDISEEEVTAFRTLKEKAKDMEEEPLELTIDATTTRYVKSGASVENLPINLDGTVQYFTEYDAYELFEPDKLSIVYIDGNELCNAYYDFLNEETTVEDTGEKAYTWSSSELAKKLPKPDSPIVVVSYDEENLFSAEIYAADKDYYDSYKKLCQEKGFSKNIDDGSWIWNAENKEGDKLNLIFDKENQTVSISLDKKDD